MTVTLFNLPQQMLIHQRGYSIQHIYCEIIDHTADCFRGLQRAAANEDGETSEQFLLIHVQQMVAPIKGSMKCLLPCRQVLWTTGQEFVTTSPSQSSKQGLWREEFHASSRQLDGQW